MVFHIKLVNQRLCNGLMFAFRFWLVLLDEILPAIIYQQIWNIGGRDVV